MLESKIIATIKNQYLNFIFLFTRKKVAIEHIAGKTNSVNVLDKLAKSAEQPSIHILKCKKSYKKNDMAVSAANVNIKAKITYIQIIELP
ncbi:hypothetical protein [Neisseria dumasiana]|uniref:hypothetical protein n=1 Tax=Neisseria dumasiana TaxID=1931275 RepID=UPI000A19162E|nr:hypothetical protein [Neisseria dumasiana]OSI15281.1 hypothetical protein BV914_07820 [Neisseria dumasiana]